MKDYTAAPIITLGRKGCIYYEYGIKSAPALENIKSIDTTGAGDNFVTGIIYGLFQGFSLCDCIKLGNVFAGYSTTKMGCYGAVITKEIIDSFFRSDTLYWSARL